MMFWARRFVVIAAAVWATVGAFGHVQAQDLRLGTLNYPPYAYANQDGTPSGITVVLVARIAARAGVEVDFQVVPLTRGLRAVAAGTLDGFAPVSETPDRAAQMDFLQPPVHWFRIVLVRRTDRFLAYDGTPASLAGLAITRIRGSFQSEALEAVLPSMTVIDARDLNGKMRLLMHGRADLATGPLLGMLETSKAIGLPVTALSPDLNRMPAQIAVPRGVATTASAVRLEAALRAAEAAGTAADFIHAYLSTGVIPNS